MDLWTMLSTVSSEWSPLKGWRWTISLRERQAIYVLSVLRVMPYHAMHWTGPMRISTVLHQVSFLHFFPPLGKCSRWGERHQRKWGLSWALLEASEDANQLGVLFLPVLPTNVLFFFSLCFQSTCRSWNARCIGGCALCSWGEKYSFLTL